MDKLMIGFVGGLLVVLAAWASWRLARRGLRRERAPTLTHEHFITSMKAVGELSVFRVMTKEVLTASDHWFGDFGKKYLNWLLSSQRITLVIEFDVDFRYDLADPAFRVDRLGDAAFVMRMPPCRHEVLIRDMRIHSEDKAELLPWLMPDVLGRFFTGGFTVEAKNKLISETRLQASRFAGDLVRKAGLEAQKSAAGTLTMLAQGLGARRVDFDFTATAAFEPEVDTSRIESAMPLPRDAGDAEAR